LKPTQKFSWGAVFALFFLSLFVSCSKEKDIASFKTFERIINVSDDLEKISIGTDLFVVLEVAASDHFLFVLTNDKNTVLKVFDLKTLKYKGSHGSVGLGPDEFHFPYQDGFRVYNRNTLSMMDRKSIRQIELDKDSIFTKTKYIKLPGLMIPLREGSFLNDSTIIGLNQPINDFQFMLYDFKNDTITHKSPYPKVPFVGSLFEKKGQLNSFMKISSTGTKILLAYEKLPLIRILSLQEPLRDNMIKTEDECLCNYLTDKDGYLKNGNSTTYYYFDMATSNQYLFAGYKKREVSYAENNKAVVKLFGKKEIHVFDFEGKPIAKLILEDWMFEYAISPDSKYIYFTHPEESSVIYRYPLSL